MQTGYRFLEHTTDAEVESYGKTTDEAFENAASALEDTMVDVKSIEPKLKEEIKVKGKDLEALLYSWLESLIVKQELKGLLFSKFKCRISKTKSGFYLKASALGEKFDPKKHEQKTSVKAPTYHGMKIIEGKDKVTMRFILDL